LFVFRQMSSVILYRVDLKEEEIGGRSYRQSTTKRLKSFNALFWPTKGYHFGLGRIFSLKEVDASDRESDGDRI